MIITKMALPRRTILRGLGTSLALPLLDAMVPAFAATSKTAAAPTRRLGVVYVPNGMAMEYWTPKTEGVGYEDTAILRNFAPFKKQTLVVSGLKALWTPAHAGASTTFLTGAAGVPGETAPVAEISMDQIVARAFERETQLASLELATEGRANAGQCSAGHSCVYINTISWRSRTTPLPMENNPRVVFERLFGDAGSTDPGARRAQILHDKSLLDSVGEKVTALKRTVGPSDQVKIEEFVEGVRDAERRIQRAEQQSDVELPTMVAPEGIPAAFADHVDLMFDLQLLAYRTDLTRVVTFMMGREVSSRTYPEIGVLDAHHPLSHHEYDAGKIATMSKINSYHAMLFAKYVEKLRATSDGDGSLFDNMLLVYGSGMSDSNAHSPLNIPVALLGGAAGRLQGNRHLKFKDDLPLANLMLTLVDKMGVPLDRLGNSSGKLAIDTVPGV
jgi:hypothetical protein